MNILLLSENLKFCKSFINMINNLTEKNKCYIAQNCNDFFKILKEEKFKIVVIENKYDIVKFRNFINKILSVINYTINVIIISNKVDNQLIIDNNSKIKIIFKNTNEKNIKIINDIIEINHSLTIEKKIKDELKAAGFNMKNKGDYILIDVIKYCYENGKKCDNLDKNIYYNVSKIIGVSKEQIKWNIIYAINTTYMNNINSLKEYFKTKDLYKPTPKALIINILNNL